MLIPSMITKPERANHYIASREINNKVREILLSLLEEIKGLAPEDLDVRVSSCDLNVEPKRGLRYSTLLSIFSFVNKVRDTLKRKGLGKRLFLTIKVRFFDSIFLRFKIRSDGELSLIELEVDGKLSLDNVPETELENLERDVEKVFSGYHVLCYADKSFIRIYASKTLPVDSTPGAMLDEIKRLKMKIDDIKKLEELERSLVGG